MPKIDINSAAEKAMHDSLAVLKAVKSKHKGNVRVKKIVLGLGEMSELSVTELATVMATLVEGSPLEDCELEVVESPGIVECRCGHVGRPRLIKAEGGFVAECERCKKIELLVREGEGVEVKSIELA